MAIPEDVPHVRDQPLRQTGAVLLARPDRGGEDGSQARSVFFATPYRATDKAECERLHGLLRYCIPKGHSVDRLDQQQVDEVCSNINSYVRGSKGDRTLTTSSRGGPAGRSWTRSASAGCRRKRSGCCP